MKKLLLILFIAFSSCREKTATYQLRVIYENGNYDTLNLDIYGDPADCYLKEGCIRYWKPISGRWDVEAEIQSAACYVRSFRIIYPNLSDTVFALNDSIVTFRKTR